MSVPASCCRSTNGSRFSEDDEGELVDPGLGTFEIFERTDAGYTQVGAVTDGRIERVPGCERLVTELGTLSES